MTLRARLLKMELLRAGVSQQTIAEAAGVDPSLVSHVIAGRRTTGTDATRVQETIAKSLGVDVAELFSRSVRAGAA